MKYSIYYSKEHSEYLVWNNSYNYVSNYRLETFADIVTYWHTYRHPSKEVDGYWYKAEYGEPLGHGWLLTNYPDVVLICETNSLDNLPTQYPELFI